MGRGWITGPCIVVFISTNLLLLFTFQKLVAHPGAKPDALSLPACTSQARACQLPDGADPEVVDAHCIDGLGVARSCLNIAPFRYLNLVKSAAATNTDGAAEPTFLYVERRPETQASCVNNMAGSFPCSQVDLLAFLPIADIGGGEGSDMWGWTDPETEREYVLMGRSTGLSFFDITLPAEPQLVGNLPSQGIETPWRDLKVYQNHVYVVSDYNPNHGIQIFDLTRLRAPRAVYTSTAHYTGFDSAHNIAINEDSGFAYASGGETCDAGLHMVDLKNPTALEFAGCYAEAGYIHDMQCVRYHGPDLAYNDREICFNANANVRDDLHTLTIVDVTDKDHPVLLAKKTDPQFYYFHQGWLTEDHRYFLSNDELDESRARHNARTYIWNVAELREPTIIGSFTSAKTGIDHNLYIRGSYAFEANYATGLRILDLSAIAQGRATEVAYLDTFPESDSTRTISAWSTYPFFRSGVVPVSSMEGLFLTRPLLPPEFTIVAKDNLLSICSPDAARVDFNDTLHLAAHNGYSGTVNLTLENAVSQAYALTAPLVTLEENGEAYVGFTADVTEISEELSELTVVASDQRSSKSLKLWLETVRSVPEVPKLIEADHLQWAAAEGATSYLLELSLDGSFDKLDYAIRTTATEHRLNGIFMPDTSYSWRVRALNACGESGISATGLGVAFFEHSLYLPIGGEW